MSFTVTVKGHSTKCFSSEWHGAESEACINKTSHLRRKIIIRRRGALQG
jgi:hypothetical protein